MFGVYRGFVLFLAPFLVALIVSGCAETELLATLSKEAQRDGDGAGNVVTNNADVLAVGDPSDQVAGAAGNDSTVGSLSGQTSRKSGSGSSTSHR